MAARTVIFLVFNNDVPTLASMFKQLLSAFFSLFFLGAASGTSFAEVTVPDALKDRIALKKTARQLNIVYFLGIALGCILGSTPFMFPGIPHRLSWDWQEDRLSSLF